MYRAHRSVKVCKCKAHGAMAWRQSELYLAQVTNYNSTLFNALGRRFSVLISYSKKG